MKQFLGEQSPDFGSEIAFFERVSLIVRAHVGQQLIRGSTKSRDLWSGAAALAPVHVSIIQEQRALPTQVKSFSIEVRGSRKI